MGRRDSAAELLALTGFYSWLGSVAFSPDGQRMASATLESTSKVKLWDAATGQEIRALEAHGARLERGIPAPTAAPPPPVWMVR